MITLEVNTSAAAGTKYVHDPTPGVVMNVDYRHHDTGGTLYEKRETWTITGYILPKEGDTLENQIAELQTKYASGLLATAKLMDDNTVLEELPTDRAIEVKSLSFPTGDGPEWATKRNYIIVLEGIDYSSAVTTSGEYEYTITYATEQSGVVTRTISGTLRDVGGEDATTLFATLKSNQGWSTWTLAYMVTDSYTQNSENTECSFNIVHRKYWLAFPSGITNCSVNTSTLVDNQNATHYSITGWFEGSVSDCNTAISALKAAQDVLIRKETSRNDYTNRTSFSVLYLTETSDIYLFQEIISVDEPIADFVHKRVLGGGAPVKQYTSWTPAQASQRGRIVRLRQYPALPPPLWNLDNVTSVQYSYDFPENFTVDGGSVYTLTYSYSFEFANMPVIPYPPFFLNRP